MLWWILAQHYLNMREFNEKILDIVVCPKTGGKLYLDKKKIFFILMIERIYIKYLMVFQYLLLLMMIPEQIKVSENKKHIQISYDNSQFLLLSSSILRSYSPSAENKKNLESQKLKKFEDIYIKKIEKVGNYAIRIIFSDGHDTGIYSWEYLYEVGVKNQKSTTP